MSDNKILLNGEIKSGQFTLTAEYNGAVLTATFSDSDKSIDAAQELIDSAADLYERLLAEMVSKAIKG